MRNYSSPEFIAPLVFANETNLGVFVWHICGENIGCTAGVDVILALYIFLVCAKRNNFPLIEGFSNLYVCRRWR
jgi:hypothetical protein